MQTRSGQWRRLVSTCVWFAAAAAGARAQAVPGWENDAVPAAPAGAFVGGLEVLPAGTYAVFDGQSVLELDPADGSVLRTLFALPAPVFGAFLRLDPAGAKLYLGESSLGDVWEIDLSSGAGRVVTNAVFPFDLAFDPAGRAALAWADQIGAGSRVSWVDLQSGALDDLVTTSTPSGPVLFGPAGELYFTTPDFSNWPPPQDATEVLRLSASQVAASVGPVAWTEADAALVAPVDGAYGLALDEAGDLFVSDPAYGLVVEVDAETGAERLLFIAGVGQGVTFLRYRAATAGAFEGWQPPASGELVAIHTDFWSFHDVLRVRPRRAVLAVNPPSPIPVGSYTVSLTDGVPGGVALLAVAGGLLDAEVPLRNRTWPAPLFFGLDLAQGWFGLLPVPLDAAGDWSVTLDNPGLGGLTLGLQAFVGAGGAGPFYGTSTPLLLVYQ